MKQRPHFFPRLWMLLLWWALLMSITGPISSQVDAFAATNNKSSSKSSNKKDDKKKSGITASNRKGFGAAPPTLEEVVAKYKTRLSQNAESSPCPCGGGGSNPGVTYADCCAPYHRREKFPETPLQVLQSRYSAFFFRLIPYIIQTTHPSNRDYRDNQVTWAKDLHRNGMFDSFEFLELQPGPEEMDGDNRAYIDFSVRLQKKDGERTETLVTEKSLFLRDPETQIWSYASGEVRSGVEGLEDTILNQ